MAKVFTITEGLENMGAIKTGGQGSVYKGRRVGEIITAIKILPTPIYSESADDKNYTAFQNEVQKLKRVNEDANPNVVKILSSGITESGNFPFIEMEYIDGPDLEELLKPPHEKIFTIKEALKVAEQLACALSHCHKADVRHGDIKSNNVKFNSSTGNYVLLDFGLAVMSDEQRRTSLRHAGAIEFMAPEQNDGIMLFQTDVYAFGVVMYELLAGVVPFPLGDRGETNRNAVMVAHLETPPPDLLASRSRLLPESWDNKKKEEEMQLPEWIVPMIYKCLEKKPEDRFVNGIQLHDHIWHNSIRSVNAKEFNSERITFLEEENKRLRREREQLQQQLLEVQQNSKLSKAGASKVLSQNTKVLESGTVPLKASGNLGVGGWLLLCLVLTIVVATIYYFSRSQPSTGNSKIIKTNTIAPIKVAAATESAATRSQLAQAKQFLVAGKSSEAFIIYSALSQQQIPEAMYFYGKLALQNKNANISCAEAFGLLKKASEKGYVPAKRTLGFLYAFADNKAALEQASYLQRCVFTKNTSKGAELLMQATLQGDTAASRMLDELKIIY